MITDTNDILKCWVNHFSSLGQSETSISEDLIKELSSRSLSYGENILESEIGIEEVEFAIRRLKKNRAGGADNISPEHLKFSGPVFRIWLCYIYNSICQLECIPQCFKDGVIIPVFKGKGKDPLQTKSYRGISLTSVLAKVFEIILSYRITPLLEAAKPLKQPIGRGSHALTQFFLGWKLQLNSRLMEITLTHVSIIWQVPLIQSNFLLCWKIYSMLVFGGNVGDYSVTGITT